MQRPKLRYSSLFIVCLFLLISSFSGCLNNDDGKEKSDETIVNPENMKGFAVYLHKSPMSSYNLSQKDLNRFELSNTPLWTEDDITYYNWTNHTFNLSLEARDRIPDEVDVGVFGIPFVVTVDETRIYMGSFYIMLSSFLPDLPIITVDEFWVNLRNYFQIVPWEKYPAVNSTVIYDALEESGKLIE